MITVLVLDALALAAGSGELTFRASCTTEDVEIEEPDYDFSSVDWYKPQMPSVRSVKFSKAQTAVNPDVALIVATEMELLQTLRVMTPLPRRGILWKVMNDCDTYFLGSFGAFTTVVFRTNMGSLGAGGSALSINDAIKKWNPRVLILLGIAFGMSRKNHQAGDVLVANNVIPYELQRIGKQKIFRCSKVPSSTSLLDRFQKVLEWRFVRPDDTLCKRYVGPILSGEKLVDNIDFKNSLQNEYPDAIGGEMEGSGLWSAADRNRKEWIIVKGVCDWGDGKSIKSFTRWPLPRRFLCVNMY